MTMLIGDQVNILKEPKEEETFPRKVYCKEDIRNLREYQPEEIDVFNNGEIQRFLQDNHGRLWT